MTIRGWAAGLSILTALGAPAAANGQSTERSFVAGAASGMTAALPAATAWLRQIDREEYGASWDSASVSFQSAVSKADWEAAARQARGPLEPLHDRHLISVAFTRDPSKAPVTETVRFQYRTQVAGGRVALETVNVLLSADSTWRGVGYFVQLQP
jgi:hypothetical protein